MHDAARHREPQPALPHLRTVAHGTQEGRVAAGALRQLAEDPLGQRRVESTQLERKRLMSLALSTASSKSWGVKLPDTLHSKFQVAPCS